MRISRRNNKGFTLLELLIAMVITLVGLLGLLQAVNIATEQNLRNASREEALQIAEHSMSQLRARPFAQISSLPSGAYNYPVISEPSRLRGVSKNYTVVRTVTTLSDLSKFIEVRARWKFKNSSTSQILQTVVAQPTQTD